MTDNHLKAWTDADLSELKRLVAEGVPIHKIADALGRTPEAVETRLREGKSFPRPVSLKQW